MKSVTQIWFIRRTERERAAKGGGQTAIYPVGGCRVGCMARINDAFPADFPEYKVTIVVGHFGLR